MFFSVFSLFFDVIHSLTDDGTDVVVCQGIKDRLPFPAGFDKAGLLQHPQLMGNGGNGHVQTLGDVAHADFRLKEYVQNFDPGGIPKNFVQLRQVVQGFFRGHLCPNFFDHVGMDVHIFAGFVFGTSMIVICHNKLLSKRHLNHRSNVLYATKPKMSIHLNNCSNDCHKKNKD